MLKRKSNDVPLIKSNSGYRASPRAVAKSASPTSNKVPEPQVGSLTANFFSIFPGCLIGSLHCFKRRLIADHITLIIPATFCFYTVSGVSPPGLNEPFVVKRNSENKLAFVTIPVG